MSLANPTSPPCWQDISFLSFFFFTASPHVLLNNRSCPSSLLSISPRGSRRKSSGRRVRGGVRSTLNLAAAARRERRPPTGLHNSLLQLLVCDSFAGRATWRTVACDRTVGFPFLFLSFSLPLGDTRWLNYDLPGQNRAAIHGFTRFRSSYDSQGCYAYRSQPSREWASDRKRGDLHETPRFVNSPRRQTRTFVFPKSHRNKSIGKQSTCNVQ